MTGDRDESELLADYFEMLLDAPVAEPDGIALVLFTVGTLRCALDARAVRWPADAAAPEDMRVIDLAGSLLAAPSAARGCWLRLVGQPGWALRVDAVEEPVTVAAADVNWRPPSGDRPWLIGLLPSHSAALLDACELPALVDSDHAVQEDD